MTSISALLLPFLGAAVILISAHSLQKREYTGKKCGDNEEYMECGSSCPPNCTHPNGVNCNKKCACGCFCKKGYVKLDNSCIDKAKCEACTGNRTYTTCGTRCPETCTYKPEFCTDDCVQGCHCNSGYVLDNDTCVLPKDCPEV
ncbi:inducible metalloproteinase inhibitor protein-like [Anomaloglossus baeobatrachus]